jgi:hypothetical protein
MSISLVTYVPHQLVVRGVVYIVKGYAELNHAKAGRKMPAVHAHDVHNVLTQFVTDLV